MFVSKSISSKVLWIPQICVQLHRYGKLKVEGGALGQDSLVEIAGCCRANRCIAIRRQRIQSMMDRRTDLCRRTEDLARVRGADRKMVM